MSATHRSILYRLLLGAALGCAAACANSDTVSFEPEPPPVDPRGCLAATLVHEEHTDDRDGVSHDVRFQERFVRCEGHVWTARLFPRGAPPQEAPPPTGHHEMPPSYELARLVTKTPEGQAELTLVSRRDHLLITIGPGSYDVERFDGDWDGAAHLLPARVVAAMPRLADRKASSGAVWREKKTENGTLRVLWSEVYDFPLEIESESAGGQKRDHLRVILEKVPADADLPWVATEGYTRKLDSDFMD
jgi:hypothetical protein